LIGGNVPFDEGVTIKSKDSISAEVVDNQVYVFVRTYTNTSHLYSSTINLETTESTEWALVCGAEQSLLTDAAVAFNSFTKLLEAFMISTDGYLYRCWQTEENKWSTWDKTGYSAPKSTHAPVVHSMDTNIFNGRLNVFIHGEDNLLHHIWQTTCDKVPNPWGWCTWSTWNLIGDQIPMSDNVVNTLSIGHNIHLGIEIFTVSSFGQLFKLWQLDRHKKWSNWEKVVSNTNYTISSLPTISNNLGWWSVNALDSSSNLMTIYPNHTFHINPTSVPFSSSVIASWKVPVDEASSKDWIAIYPASSKSNEDYLDYSYVGGSQNPLSQAIPEGETTFDVYLPSGTYKVKYLVDKRFVSVSSTNLIVTSSSTEKDWVQVFRGIFIGLNLHNVSIEQCVKDAEHIPVVFEKALQEFDDRQVHGGLHDLGEAISLVANGMKDCGIEEAFVSRVRTFITDLIACAKQGSCTHFVIDLGKELLVLYENIYEIYSDIRAASNCFKIKAYAQGAYNIGRVIAACVALPRIDVH